MAEVLRKAAVPVERRRHSGVGAGKARRDGEPGLWPAHALVNVLLVEDPVPAAQNSVLYHVLRESDTGREAVVMSIEELCPTLATGAGATEDVCPQEPSGSRIRDCGV